MGKSILKVSICAVIWLFIAFLGVFSGLIHPACFAYSGAVIAFLWSFVYFYAAASWQRFGAATILNGFYLVICLVVGEGNPALIIGVIALTVISEVIRAILKYNTTRGVIWSYIPAALSLFPYAAHWWTETEDSLAEAMEDMPAGYAAKMEAVINNTVGIVIAVSVGIALAFAGIILAKKIMKKKAAELN